MSDPTRYRVANNQAQLTLGGGILAVDPAGPLVMYDDYARLKAEVERLRNLATKIDAYVDVLVLENGRLRKAGDWMADEMLQEYGRKECLKIGSFNAWLAAKEGKQS